MAEGYVMTIPKTVLDKLDQADAKITKIAESSQKTQTAFVSAFQSMANGVDPLLQKLEALKAFGNFKLDSTFKNSATAAEKAADSIAKVATQLNKINDSSTSNSSAKTSVLAWQGINENLKIQQARLDAVNRSIKEYENTLARINAGKGGVVSQADQTAYTANLQEAQAIQKTIAAYELKQQRIVALQQAQRQQLQYEKELISLAQGSQSLPEQRKNEELRKMNQYYKELEVSSKKEEQQAEKTAAAQKKATEAAAKRAAAEKNKSVNKESNAAAKAEEMYHKALAKTEVTITQRARKIEALTNAQRALNATGRDYSTQLSKIASETQRLQRANEKVEKSTRKLRSEQSKIMDISGQLARKFALLFSVSAMTGYVNKLVEVRGEFELQNRALQSILQNKEQANEIWDKTVQLAVRSPFTVKELVTYTKQLAAYRIEADKLYDTNKMLADVSAGLGVSMDRLILAFGQVKAANYLRASEVRQFTEAGVNILGELSAIYTELEGKMVSVGDVQERITKRMVTFGDVEEVFKRITSAGGIFYNMQEVQAETLAGMMSNLQDTFDLMFNDIGKANDGVLKGFVSALRSIVESWRTIAQVAVPIISVLALRWATVKAQTLLAGGALKNFIERSTIGLKMVGSQLSGNAVKARALRMEFTKMGGISFNMWATALSLVAIAAWEVYNAISEARRQQEELNKIAIQGSFDASKSVAEYKRLADIVADTTKTYDEQKEALDTLKRTYGDILPAHLLEAKTIRELQGNYEGATEAIYNYVAAKTQEKQIRFVADNEGEKVSKSANKLSSELRGYIKEVYGAEVANSELLPVLTKIQKGFEDGSITLENYEDKFKELIKSYFGFDNIELPKIETPKWYEFYSQIERGVGSYLQEYVENIQKYKDEIDSIISSSSVGFGTLVERKMAESIKPIDSMVNDVQKSLNTLFSSKDNPLITYEQIEKAKKTINSFYREVGTTAPDLSPIINGSKIDLTDIKREVQELGLTLNKYNLFKEFGDDASGFVERLDKAFSKGGLTDFQKRISKMVVSYAKENKMAMNGLEKALANAEESSQKYLPRITQAYKDLIEEIARLEFAPSPDFGTVSPEQMQEMKNLAKVYKMIIDSYPKTEKKKGESEADKRLKKQLALLKEIGKAYKENRKYYNEEDAVSKTRTDYKAAAAEAGISNLVATMEFDPRGLISAIEELAKNASNKVKLLLERAIAEVRGEVDLDVRVKNIKNVQDEIEKVLSNYEITVSMGKAFPAIDREDLGKLFNFDTYTLEEAQNKINQLWIDKANERERIVASSEGRIARTYETGYAAAASLGEEGVKKYENNMKKISDAQSKELDARLKRFGEYINKSLDLQKAVQQEVNQDLLVAGNLFKNGMINAQQYSTIVKNVTDEANKKIGQINLDKFKDSPDYIKMIGDTSQYSKKELQELLDKMQEFISLNAGNMDSQQLKSLLNDMDKIRKSMDEIDEKNPFNQSLFAQIKKMKQARKEYNQELENNKRLAKEAAQAEKELQEAQKNAQQTQTQYGKSSDPNDKEKIGNAAKNVDSATEKLNNANGALKQSNGALGQAGAKLEGIQGKMGGAMGMVDKIVTGIYQSINATIDLMNQFKDLAQSNGVDTSKGGWREAQQAGEVLGNVNEKVMSSWNNFKSGNFAGAIADAVGSITTIFTTLNKQHDARREQKIQDEIKLVNKLSMAYQHLARKIENAYTIDTYNMAYENAERNLKEQIASTERMIAAEKDKKDQDDERIAEWQDQILQYQEQLEDLKAQKLQELGGFGSGSAMADAASEFASAWMEAYMETGDGLDALNDKWDEFIQNIVVKQLALRGVSKFLEPIMKQIDAAIGNDSYLSTDELAKIKASVEEMNPKLNAYFKDIMEGFGDMLPQPGSASELTGLSKSIQGVSEDTANVIEAYLNSMRFFVADTNMQVQKLALLFSADPTQNPMYSELMSQTRLLRSIDDRLASVITASGNHPLSGFAIKSII